MAAPCVTCAITLKSGQITHLKQVISTSGVDKQFKHDSLRHAISSIRSDVNAFLTTQVEVEKQQNVERSRSDRVADGAGGPGDEQTGGDASAGDSTADSEDPDLEDDGEDDEETQDVDQTSIPKRKDDEDCQSNSNKKPKISTS